MNKNFDLALQVNDMMYITGDVEYVSVSGRDLPVHGHTHTDPPAHKHTHTDLPMDTPTQTHLPMDTPTQTCLPMDTPTQTCLPMDTPHIARPEILAK